MTTFPDRMGSDGISGGMGDPSGPSATRADALPEPQAGLGHSVTPTIADLEEAKRAADRALYNARRERDAEKQALLDAETARIDALISTKHGDKVSGLNRIVSAASEALDAAKAAAATVPTDAVVYEWDKIASSKWARDYKLKPTGRAARFEIVTRDSKFPANKSWGIPKPGDIILRLLKKDGSAGLQFVTWPLSSWSSVQWEQGGWSPIPEGDVP